MPSSHNALVVCASISREIVLYLVQHEDLCQVGVLFYRGHPI